MQDANEEGFNEVFGERVRLAREARGWSQRQLAEALEERDVKLDPSAVTRIERGSREVKLREAAALATALRVRLQDLARLPAANPRDQLDDWLESANEWRHKARNALASMANNYDMLISLLTENPTLLSQLTPKATDISMFLGMETYKAAESATPIVHLTLDDAHLDLLQRLIAASVTNLVAHVDDDEPWDEDDAET